MDQDAQPLGKILAVQFLSFVALGMSMPVLPDIYSNLPEAQRGGDHLHPDEQEKHRKLVGASLMMTGTVLNALGQWLVASLYGALSDSFGRKPFLVLACFGQFIDQMTVAYTATDYYDGTWGAPYKYAFTTNAWIAICIARSAAGLCGNVQLMTRTFVGDASSAQNAAQNFGKLGAMAGVAMILGPSIGAMMVNKVQMLRGPIFIGAILNLVCACIAASAKESLDLEFRTRFEISQASPLSGVLFLLSRKFLMFFGLMSLVDSLSQMLFFNVIPNYNQTVYNFTPTDTAQFMMLMGVSTMLIMVFVQGPLVKKLGEFICLKIGYMCTCVAYALFGLIYYAGASGYPKPKGDIGSRCMFLSVPVFCLGLISNPTQVSIGSRCVEKFEQGKFQGANGGLDLIGNIVGPLLASAIFRPTAQAGMPNAIFLLAALIVSPGIWVAFNIRSYMPPKFETTDSIISGHSLSASHVEGLELNSNVS